MKVYDCVPYGMQLTMHTAKLLLFLFAQRGNYEKPNPIRLFASRVGVASLLVFVFLF